MKSDIEFPVKEQRLVKILGILETDHSHLLFSSKTHPQGLTSGIRYLVSPRDEDRSLFTKNSDSDPLINGLV